ncbi:MAG: acyl-CoA dehydrogenase family protein [Alphaproteobacteria bacterium]|jgi:alkylation response protein AidB-like acyl-CoA dehydrogenase
MSDMTEAEVRAEVRTFLQENWHPDWSLLEWRNILVDSGWGAPHYPKEWHGRGLSPAMSLVVDEVFREFEAVGAAKAGIRTLAGATILAHGSDLHKRTFLRGILTGAETWCQLFSEPGSGSDLAGAATRADFKDGKWVINGQKVWTTSAHHAHFGLLLARTDWDQVKHKGMTFFIIDMHQPGVDVHQLKQMNGHASFNQVFLTDAVLEEDMRVSELGEGWKVATTTLMHERRGADGARRYDQKFNKPGQVYEEYNAELDTMLAPYVWYPQRTGRADLLIEHAEAMGKFDDPSTRQRIAKVLTLQKANEWTARRARAAQDQGKPQGPEGSIGKLAASVLARAANQAHTQIAGANAMLSGDDSWMDGTIAEILISTPAISIAGGTDEIQRNIISERILQMPKEPRTDTDRPFRDVPRNQVG